MPALGGPTERGGRIHVLGGEVVQLWREERGEEFVCAEEGGEVSWGEVLGDLEEELVWKVEKRLHGGFTGLGMG